MADGAGAGAHYFALPTGSKLYEFEIEALLGHGGFGITYRATDTLLQETVAIKEFLPNELAIRISDATVRAKSQQAEPDFDAGLKSFLEEARVMARFRHPRIVHVRRFFELHGTGYIVLDYERGKTLSERLSDGPIPDPELRSILSGVLDGLEVIHARAILHRDLKPNNIMLREDGAPVIIDFGAARDFQARHSRSITAIATAGYAPPEQYGVGGQQGPWSDLYALGAIAYRAVSGEPPVDSLRRLRKDPLVPAVVAGAGKYDEALLRTIDWMLKIDEEDRPTSVEQVREALRGGPIAEAGPEISRTVSEKAKGAVSNDGLRTPESGTPSAARPPLRRVGVTAIAISLVVLAGLSAGSYAFYANYQAKQQAERQTQQANDRQRLLAELLGSAGTDQSKLERFLTTCGLTCPDDLRTQAQARIDTAKQKQQAELARQEEAAYRAARGDPTKLRAYDLNCTVCGFRDAARSEISAIDQQQRQAKLAPHETVSPPISNLPKDLPFKEFFEDFSKNRKSGQGAAASPPTPSPGPQIPKSSANNASPSISQGKPPASSDKVNRGWLGVRIQRVTDEIAESLNIKPVRGALIAGVEDRGPAKPAGIEPGDVVVKFDGKDIKEPNDLSRVAADTVVGKEVDVVIVRKGEEQTKKVTLGRLEENDKPVPAATKSPEAAEKPVTQKALGLDLATLSEDLRSRYKIKDSVKGVVITSVDGASDAAAKRLDPGDVVVEVAQDAVSNAADIKKRIEQLKKDGKKSVLLLVSNALGELRFVALMLW